MRRVYRICKASACAGKTQKGKEEEKSKKIFQARYFGKNGKKQEIHSQEETNKILENIKNAKYTVTEVKKGERKRTPAPPFTTSTMQQEASRKLGFTLKKTMSVAQGLYEGVKISEKGTVGLITYMRTDSTRISEEARAAAKEQIIAKYGEKYYENRYYKTGKDAQDAHEGIRPTYINIDPDSIKDELTLDQYKLYKLIYNRFMASQMKPAVYDTMAVNIKANEYDFKANGQNLKFKGFMTLYVEGTDGKEEQEEGLLPELVENQEVKLEKIFNLKQRTLEDTWILRNYLLEKVEKTGQQPVPFTALSGDWHRHWFLNSNLIDQQQMSKGDN